MSGIDNNEPESVLRLTKDVRRQLLEQNDGFTTKTHYEGKNFTEDRTYTIRDSELHIGSNSNTSWADSRQRSEHVADEAETHRFLYNNLGLLDQDDVVVGASRPKVKSVADTSANDVQVPYDDFDGNDVAEGDADAAADDDDDETKVDDGLSPGLVVAVTVVALTVAAGLILAGVAVWKKTAKPALERRRAARAEQKAADEHAQVHDAENPEAVAADEG